MDGQLVFDIVIIALLILVIVLLFIGKNRTSIDTIAALLKQNNEEQRDSVAKQIGIGATEQFQRFGVIQETLQSILKGNREENNKHLREFQAQIDARLSAIQQGGVESNEKISVSVNKTLHDSCAETNEQLEKFSSRLDVRLSSVQEQTQATLQASREEINKRLAGIQESVQSTLHGNREEINKQLREFQTQIDAKLSAAQQSSVESSEKINTRVNKTLHDSHAETNEQLEKLSAQLDARLSSIQEQTHKTLQSGREEINKQLHGFQERLDVRLSSIQRDSSGSIDKINVTLENRMKLLQESNEKRLEQMQGVVDDKLQKTLETRLTHSFELVSKQLDSVQQGLGEMRSLAADAKTLKNAFTNINERGTYGEIRLEKLLSDILAPNQYSRNVEIDDTKFAEFVINLPGNGNAPLLLPIASKFPVEEYNCLLDAGNKQEFEDAKKSLALKILESAKDIRHNCIAPPKTTDFALMFLPTEGLFAEAVQNVALFEELRENYKVIAVGPTTLSALLGSLLIGFKTLALEKRSQDVWNTLRGVKTEFIKFGDLLEEARKQIQKVDNTIVKIVGAQTKVLNQTLSGIEEPDEIGISAQLGSESEE